MLLFACLLGVPLILRISRADAYGGTDVWGGMPQCSFSRLGALGVPERDVILISDGIYSIGCHCVSITCLCILYWVNSVLGMF